MAQLADFDAWCKSGPQGADISLIDYVGFVATPDLLFGFASLFWPDLIVHEERRFLASGFSPALYEQWRAKGLNSREIQRVMNHVHISTLFQNQQISDEIAVEAARLLATTWSRTLGPEGLAAEAVGSNLDDAAVTFFED
ncbi:MAG: hypothetical protein IPM54_12950 [Polyangiaceae bacterium]|nr:hypothetical protein [Polyangiaceae bacterium]